MVNFGDEMMLNSDEDDATVRMEEDSVSTHADSSNQTKKMDTLVCSGHSITWECNSTQKFNCELTQIKDHHHWEMEKA